MGKRPISSSQPVRRPTVRRRPSTAPKEKPFVRSTARRVTPSEVELIPGRTAKIAGGHRLYWRVLCSGESAGHVSINCLQGGVEVDASIDVQLNRRNRGRGIGTIAFQRACELSGLTEVLASIRKGNIASQIAVERAGFVPLEDERSGELLMIWRRRG
jgi:RimJ/RimL family protein N-acetyltransferase